MADCATEAARESRLLGGRLRLLQPDAGYRVAIDPVLLAAAVPAQPGQSLLELGCGSGAASLCLLARVGGAQVTGLELNSEMATLARRSAEMNALPLSVVEGDLLRLPDQVAGRYDQVFMNPPYLAAGAASPSSQPTRAAANLEGAARLSHWIDAALSRLPRGGRLTLIHRADRIDEILALLHGRTGDLAVLPLRAYADRPAKRVIVTGRKDKGKPLTLLPDFILHDDGGCYSPAAQKVLRQGEAIDLLTPAQRSSL